MPFWRDPTSAKSASDQMPGHVACAARIADLELECADLQSRLASSEQTLRERTERLYAIEQEHSTEHFGLAESTRLLKIERLRNAGAIAQRNVILERARQLQERIGSLKERLRVHEAVDELYFDTAAMLRGES